MHLYFPNEGSWDDTRFPIPHDFSGEFNTLLTGAKDMLKRGDLTPQLLTNIGYFQFVASRLPLITAGLELEVRVYSGAPDGPRRERFLRIDERTLQISTVECFEVDYGLQHHIDTILECETSGYVSGDDYPPVAILERLSDWMSSWLAAIQDGEWTIAISCVLLDFDWNDQPEDENPWAEMPYFC